MPPRLAVWERITVALEVPLCELFYDVESLPHLPNLPGRKTADEIACVAGTHGFSKKGARNYSEGAII